LSKGEEEVRRLFCLTIAALLMIALSGCLGTLVQSPTRQSQSHVTTRLHLLAAPARIDADTCPDGLSEVFTYVPLLGVAVGILTFGIIVPMTTSYSCAVKG
jgi:hypothetical protein